MERRMERVREKERIIDRVDWLWVRVDRLINILDILVFFVKF